MIFLYKVNCCLQALWLKMVDVQHFPAISELDNSRMPNSIQKHVSSLDMWFIKRLVNYSTEQNACTNGSRILYMLNANAIYCK